MLFADDCPEKNGPAFNVFIMNPERMVAEQLVGEAHVAIFDREEKVGQSRIGRIAMRLCGGIGMPGLDPVRKRNLQRGVSPLQ
ncbi:MAG TPA: hypothetical protein VKX17_16360 [Planctomycetota bacterium]|nr:hypothetical protein [Planctomycetota bacterium]